MARVFRLFISSTFQDWQAEREYLRHHIFPELGEWVTSKAKELDVSARFLPVDLRWGVSEEAGKTHATVDICLNEIRRCQEKANRPNEVIKPNFLVFLGQRYGWRPVPPQISQEHWQKLIDLGVINNLFLECYEEDLNAVPSEWVLKAIDGDWQEKERSLRKSLDDSYLASEEKWKNEFSQEELAFLIGSVTEQEIVRGAFQANEAEEHVHVFIREINNPPKEFRSEDELLSPGLLSRLKGELETRGFPIHAYALDTAPKSDSSDYLKKFGVDVREALTATIAHELKVLSESGDIDAVEAPDLNCFVDRSELHDLLLWNARGPMMLYGHAGTGKSTLLAKAANQMRSTYSIVTYWIGRDSRCASGIGLLQAMICDLHNQGFIEKTDDLKLDALLSMKYQKLEAIAVKALKSLDNSIRIIIDAVDQLPEGDPARSLQWLPSDVPVLLSSLDDEQKHAFESRCPDSQVVLVSGFGEEKSKELLNLWFRSIRTGARTLQADQREALLKEYNGRPLHLRVLFERAIHLRSFDGIPDWLGGDSLPTEDAISDLYNHLASETEHGAVMLQRTLAYLVSTPFGVPEDVLLALLRNDDEVVSAFRTRSPNSPDVGKDRLPEVVWSRLYHDLEPFLARRSFFGEEYLSFYHAQFGRVITAKSEYWIDTDIIRDCRSKIEMLANNPENMQRPSKVNKANLSLPLRRFLYRHATANVILLSELAGNEPAGACKRLTSFAYLMARLEVLPANEVDALFGEYRALEDKSLQENSGIQDWSRFMQGNAHLLRCGDELWPANRILLQLGIEHADDSPITIQAEQWLDDGGCDWLWLRSANRPEHYVPDSCMMVIAGHTGKVTGLELLSNNIAISSSWDQTLCIWNLNSGKCIKVLKGHKERIRGISLLSETHFLSWSDHWIIIWSLDSYKPLNVLNLSTHMDQALKIKLLSEEYVLIEDNANHLHLWNLNSGQCDHPIEENVNKIEGVSRLPNGMLFSWLGQDLFFWKLNFGQGLQNIKKIMEGLNGARLLDDYRALFQKENGSLYVVDLNYGQILHELSGCSCKINGFKLLPDERVLLWSRFYFGIPTCIWNLKSGELVTFKGDEVCRDIGEILLLPNGRVLSWSRNSTLYLWNLDSGTCIKKFNGHTDKINGVRLMPSDCALSFSDDGTLRIWDLNSVDGMHTFDNNPPYLANDAKILGGYVLSWFNRQMILRKLNTGQPFKALDAGSNEIAGAKDLPDGRIVFWQHKTIRIWNVESGEVIDLVAHADMINGIELIADGRMLSWSKDGQMCIWNLYTRQCIKILKANSNAIAEAKELPDGQIVFWQHKIIRIWNVESGGVKDLVGHTGGINGIELISNGRMLSWSKDGKIHLWKLNTGQSLMVMDHETAISGRRASSNIYRDHTLKPSASIKGVKLLDDGTLLSWSINRPCILVWNLESGKCQSRLQVRRRVHGVESLSNELIFSWEAGGTICLWDLRLEKCLHVVRTMVEKISFQQKYCLSFHGKGDEYRNTMTQSIDISNDAFVFRIDGHVAPLWFGNSPILKEVADSNTLLVLDGGNKLKIIHPWLGKNQFTLKSV